MALTASIAILFIGTPSVNELGYCLADCETTGRVVYQLL
jgi:hypothetical protein